MSSDSPATPPNNEPTSAPPKAESTPTPPNTESAAPPVKAPRTGRVLLVVGIVAIGAGSLAFFGITNRAKSRQAVATWTDAQTVPTVRIVRPERGPTEQELV